MQRVKLYSIWHTCCSDNALYFRCAISRATITQVLRHYPARVSLIAVGCMLRLDETAQIAATTLYRRTDAELTETTTIKPIVAGPWLRAKAKWCTAARLETRTITAAINPNSTYFDLLWSCWTTAKSQQVVQQVHKNGKRTTNPKWLNVSRCCTACCNDLMSNESTTNRSSGVWATANRQTEKKLFTWRTIETLQRILPRLLYTAAPSCATKLNINLKFYVSRMRYCFILIAHACYCKQQVCLSATVFTLHEPIVVK